jgi:putative tryptophan/tyrosine transport system substrate-binding protein
MMALDCPARALPAGRPTLLRWGRLDHAGAGMRRRDFFTVFAGGVATWPLVARAQQSEKVPRIGYLSPGPRQPRDEAFRQRLQELGYVEGKNIIIEYRFAEGKFERLPALAQELVRLEVDVIVSVVTQASLAARHATKTIPIVIVAVSDPLGSGLVTSLARPGANVTGTSAMSSEVVGKSLELLREAVPKASRVAVIWNPDNAIFQSQMLRETQLAAGRLGIELRTFAVRSLDELEPAFVALTNAQAGALLLLMDPAYTPYATRITDLANNSRLPTMYGLREFAVAGGLMAYGPNFPTLFQRAADYVDKLLKGAKPADLPVEQPTKFELILNVKTAKTLGLAFPTPLLGRADEVIE